MEVTTKLQYFFKQQTQKYSDKKKHKHHYSSTKYNYFNPGDKNLFPQYFFCIACPKKKSGQQKSGYPQGCPGPERCCGKHKRGSKK